MNLSQQTKQSLEKGIRKGRLDGLEEGVEKGILAGMKTGRLLGMNEGKAKTLRKIALKLLRLNMPIDKIVQLMELSSGEVNDLKSHLQCHSH